MKKASIASLLALLLSLPAVAAAAVPRTLAFSARIADAGRPVTGSHTVKFTFWDCDGTVPASCVDPANVLWKETQTLTAADGVVTAVLGADTTTPNPLPFAIFNGAPLFLEVTFDGTAFTPRMTVHAVPYAARALLAENVPVFTSATMSATTAVGTSCTNYSGGSVSLTAPAAGQIVVRSSAFILVNHALNVTDQGRYHIGTTATDCADMYGSQWATIPGIAAAATYYLSVAPMRAFTVGPGTYTYYLNGISFGGTEQFIWGRLDATFLFN